MKTCLLLLLIFLLACTSNKATRKIASTDELITDLSRVKKELNDPEVFNAKSCSSYANSINDYLISNGANTYLPRSDADRMVLTEHGTSLAQELFGIRLLIREKIQEFYGSGTATVDCIDSLRRSLRYARNMEEVITEWFLGRTTKSFTKHDHEDHPLQLYLNPKFENSKLKSGDILLVRSESFVSATIARLGRQAGQFSHAALIYIDDQGAEFVIESLINGGLSVVPISEWRKASHARSIVYRHQDTALASRSAKALYDRIAESKKKILYDFKMNTSDNSEFFCTEVIREAYNLGSEGVLLFPTFQTSFESLKTHGFVKSLGIDVMDTFSPNDLEVEPNIDLVFEWRNPEKTRKVRVQDAVLESMLTWMRERDYYLHNDLIEWSKVTLAMGIRKLGFLKSLIPENMTRPFLKNFMLLQTVSQALENHLMAIDEEHFLSKGYSLSFNSLLEKLEKYRQEDCQRYIDYTEKREGDEFNHSKTPEFHFNFRPRKGSCGG